MFKNDRFPKRILVEANTQCNLKCKMCWVHSINSDSSKKFTKRKMPLENFEKILEEVKDVKPLMHPELYGEILVNSDFKEIVKRIKNKGMAVAINTNGTLVNEDFNRFFIDAGIDSINFSLNAITKETYKKIHGVDKLDDVKQSVLNLVKMRGNNLSPRIGVSFVRQDENVHEETEFIDFWSKYVDVIRVSAMMGSGEHDDHMFKPVPKKRIPCKMIYETMPIFFNGDVSLCCRDHDGRHKMGNIFEKSIEEVWNGPAFNKVRKLHEEGRWDEISLCAKCDGWAGSGYTEEVTDKFVIKKSAQCAYYNVIDRLEGWEEYFLGGHKKPSIVINQS